VSGQECADAVLEKLQELTMAAVEMRDTVEAFYANQERADAGKDAALLEALRKIAAIENKMYGGDWDEIEEARSIASIAILAANKEPK
jgi:hypothetical protein